MSLEDIAYSIVGLIFIVLISAVVICLGLMVYFYFTETPVPPTAEEIEQIQAKYREDRSNKAFNYCWLALGVFALGWLTGNPGCRTVGTILLIGAGIWDYEALGMALFFWYVIVPALLVMAIIGFFKRS